MKSVTDDLEGSLGEMFAESYLPVCKDQYPFNLLVVEFFVSLLVIIAKHGYTEPS